MFQVEYFSNVTDATKYVDLQYVPDSTQNVAMDLVGGTAQALTNDFGVVDGTRVTWDSPSYNLYTQFDSSSDTVRVIYDRS